MLGKELSNNKRVAGDKLIGSLALMRASILPNDFISSYVPFIATLIHEKGYSTIDVESIVEDFSSRYGFIIPNLPMQSILGKCIQAGVIRNINRAHEPNMEKVNEYKFGTSINKEILKYESIIYKLQDFSEKNHAKRLDADVAEDVFLTFLEINSAKTLTLMFADNTEEERKSKQNSFIVCDFISNASKTDINLFSLIREISFAYMMASAITYGLKVEGEEEGKGSYDSSTNFQGLSLYLDTPFILKLLGLNTKAAEESCLDLITGLKASNVKLKVFEHTVGEVTSNLQQCEYWLDGRRVGSRSRNQSVRNLLLRGEKKADVSMRINNLMSDLHDFGIEIDKTDYYHPSKHSGQVDEEELKAHIMSIYKETSQDFDEERISRLLEYDVRSISGILALWNKKVYRSYFEAEYLFLTSPTLTHAIRRLDAEENSSSEHNVFPCISEVFLGTIMWLNSPVSIIEAFSQKKLLADCMAAMVPSEELIEKLAESIERLYKKEKISQEEYYLLRARGYTQDHLQKLTLNDEDAFTDETTIEMLDNLKQDLIAEKNDEMRLLQSRHDKITEEKDAEIVNLASKADEALEKNKRLEKMISDRDAIENERIAEENKRRESYTENVKKRLETIAVTIPIVIAFFGLIFVLIRNTYEILPDLNTFLTIAAAILAVITASISAILKTDNRVRSALIEAMVKRKEFKNYKKRK